MSQQNRGRDIRRNPSGETPHRLHAGPRAQGVSTEERWYRRGIAGKFPELAPRLRGPEPLTMSEQYQMPVFDAMAFALTFFYFRNRSGCLKSESHSTSR